MTKFIAKGQDAKSSRITNKRLKSLLSTSALVAAGVFALSGPAFAVDTLEVPTGGSVVGGSATIDSSQAASGVLDINQSSDRTTIDWATFNIGTDAITTFYQPNSGSIAVNRVANDGDPSQILGTLRANGQIFVLDVNGVFFGQDATIDVGGIVASTGDLMNQSAFLNGANPVLGNFGSGAIINEATINISDAGLAAFVAPTVINNGIINARMGRVALLGVNGDATVTVDTLDLYGDGLFEVTASTIAGEVLAENAGTINAKDGGVVTIETATVAALVDGMINVNGIVDVSSVTVAGGKIILGGGDNSTVNIAGTLEASGTDGGSIDATGGDINIAKDAVLQADASVNGDGGEVFILASNTTIFEGTIFARGGSESGDGGSAEVSGLFSVGYHGLTDLSAFNGEMGTLLIDPAFSVIHSGVLNNPLGLGYVLSAQALANSLNGSNIVVQADDFIDVGTRSTAYNTGNLLVDAVLNLNLFVGAGDVDLSTWNFLIWSGTTSGNLTLDSAVVNFNKNLTMGTGGVTVDADIVNLTGTVFDHTGSVIIRTKLDGNADTVNVLADTARIQQGIEFAGLGATVNVAAGTYNESVIVDKDGLILLGANAGIDPNTAARGPEAYIDSFDGSGTADAVVVNADDVTIDGFQIRSDGRGVEINGGDGNSVANNIIETVSYINGADEGIYAAGATNLSIASNQLNTVDNHGIGISGGENISITDNVIDSPLRDGINMDGTSGAAITGNTISGANGDEGIDLRGVEDVEVSDNTIDGAETGVYVQDSDSVTVEDNTIASVDYGVQVLGSDDVEVAGNTISGNSEIGVYVYQSDYAVVKDNALDNFKTGIKVEESDVVQVRDNEINDTNDENIYGIHFVESDDGDIRGNEVNDAGTGIFVDESDDATLDENKVNDSDSDGIRLANADDAVVRENEVSNAGGAGINVADSDNLAIRENVVADVLGDGITVDNADGVDITENEIDGAGSNGSTEGIEVTNSDDVDILENTVEGAFSDGIRVAGSEDVDVKDNTVDGTNFDEGIDIESSLDVLVSGNTVMNTGFAGEGIEVQDSEDVRILDNDIDNTGLAGIIVTNSEEIEIADNEIDSTGDDGIEATNVDGLEITGNRIGLNGGTDNINGEGIDVNGAPDAVITDNTVTETVSNGISVNPSPGSIITGNIISNVGADGIHVLNSDGTLVDDNSITNAGDDGVNIVSSEDVIVSNNTIDTVGNNGVEVVDASHGAEVDTNTILNAGWDGVNVRGSNGVDVVNNTITDVVGASGVAVLFSEDSLVDNNDITNTGRLGVYVGEVDGIVISNNTIANAGIAAGNWSGIHLENTNDAAVTGNDIDGATLDGVNVGGVINFAPGTSSNVTIDDNTIINVGRNGIYGTAGILSASGNTVDNTGADGIEVSNSAGVQITDNLIGTNGGTDNIGAEGIDVNNSNNANISGNTITETVSNGISVNPSDYVMIADNDISNAGADGINVLGGIEADILRNTIANSGDDGIEVNDNQDVQINQNEISRSGDDGIHVIGSRYASLVGNDIFGALGDGIEFYQGNGTANASGNEIYKVRGHGIWANTPLAGSGYVITANDIIGTGLDGIRVDKNAKNVSANRIDFTGGHGIVADQALDNALFNANKIGVLHGSAIGNIGRNGLMVTNSYAPQITNNGVAYAALDGIHVENSDWAYIYNNTVSSVGGNGIYVNPTDYAQIGHNDIYNAGLDGIHLLNGSYGNIYNNNVYGAGDSGIEVSGNYDVSVTNNYTTNTGGDGIQVWDSYSPYIYNNDVYYAGDDGIDVERSNHAQVNSNYIYDTNHNGIEVTGSYSPDLYYNSVYYAGDNGIYVGNGDYAYIYGNNINDSGQNGILVNPSDYVQILRNNIYYSGSDGIKVEGGSYADIAYNTIDETDGDGIDVDSNNGVDIWGNWLYDIGNGSGDDNGIEVSNSNNAEIWSNNIYRVGDDGIEVDDSNNASIYRNYIENVGDDGIDVDDSNRVNVSSNTIRYAGDDGIVVDDSNYANITSNDVRYVDGDGIDLEDSNHSYIGYNTVRDADDNGIEVQNSDYTTIAWNDVRNVGLNGIYVNPSDYIKILDNSIYSADEDGIHVEEGYDVRIRRNDIHDVGRNGIDVKDNGYVIITDNLVHHADAGTGIHVDHTDSGRGDFVKISRNDIAHVGENGIYAWNMDEMQVRRNRVEDAGATGINIGRFLNADVLRNRVFDVGEDGIFADGYNDDGLGYSITVENNTVRDAGDNGIQVGYTDEVFIGNNVVRRVQNDGISVYNASEAIVDDNLVRKTGDDGIEVRDSGYTKIRGNIVKEAGYYGNGDEYGADGISVRNVAGYNNGSGEYVMREGFNVVIEDNLVKNTADDGIEVVNSRSTWIDGNEIRNAGIYGGADYFGADGIHVRNVTGLPYMDYMYAVSEGSEKGPRDSGPGTYYGPFGAPYDYSVVIIHNDVSKTGDDGIEVVGGEYDDYGYGKVAVYGGGYDDYGYTGRTLIAWNSVEDAGYGEDHAEDGYGADGIHVRGVHSDGYSSPYFLSALSEGGGYEEGYFPGPDGYGYSVEILYNDVTRTGDDGIEVLNSGKTLIAGNTVLEAGYFGNGDRYGADGIAVYNINDVYSGYYPVKSISYGSPSSPSGNMIEIIDNVVGVTGDDGIEVAGSGRTLVSGNNVSDAGYYEDGDRYGADGIHIRNIGDGYEGRGSHVWDVRVIGNSVERTGDDGIEVVENNGTLIAHNDVVDAGYFGNGDFYGADGIHVRDVGGTSDPYYDYGYDEGSESYGSRGPRWDVKIYDNTVSNSGDDGIQVLWSGNTLIEANDVANSGTADGERLFGGDGINVVTRTESDRRYKTKEYYGSSLPETTVHIIGNTVDNSLDDGIQVVGATDVLVDANHVSNSGDDGINILGFAGYYTEREEKSEDDYYPEVALLGSGPIPYFMWPEFNAEVTNNVVTNSGGDGAQIEGFDNILFANNDISNSVENGLYVSGFNNGYVEVSGNIFTDNDIGAHFESGLIDLTGEGNEFIDGRVGLRFAPYAFSDYGYEEGPYETRGYGFGYNERDIYGSLFSYPFSTPSEGYAPLALVDNDGPGGFGGTIGEQFFDGQSQYFVELDNEAFFAPGLPTLLNGLDSTYVTPFGTVRPSTLPGNILTQDVYDFLESRFFHYVDRGDLGLFFFGFESDQEIDLEDVLKTFDPFAAGIGGVNVTLTALPTLPGGEAFALASLAPFAGGDLTPEQLAGLAPAAGGEIDPDAAASFLAGIAPAAGGADEACWSDAIANAGTGVVVNYSFGSGMDEILADTSRCQGGL